jgi:hypothetical protein
MAADYIVEVGYLYVTMGGVRYRFQVVDANILRNEDSMGLEGTYVSVK